MTVFDSEGAFYEVFLPYLDRLVEDENIKPKFLSAGTAFRVNHTDPDASLVLDSRSDEIVVKSGDEARGYDVDVELNMSADDGHKFWLGKLNLPVALAKRKVRVEGPVTKVMGIVPALQPAHELYRSYLVEAGKEDLLV